MPLQVLDVGVLVRLRAEVHREHAPARPAAIGCMPQVLVEEDNVARLRLQREAGQPLPSVPNGW